MVLLDLLEQEKTSLFKCMVGLNRNYTGIIKIFGKDLKKKSREIYKKIGYMPQTNNFNSRFPATVKEIVELGSLGIKKNKENMEEISHLTGISEFMTKRIVDLSGGQQQRVMIAKKH